MSRTCLTLDDLLRPVRRAYLAALSQRIHELRAAGYVLETEPLERTPEGGILRKEVLNLPRRRDALCIENGQKTLFNFKKLSKGIQDVNTYLAPTSDGVGITVRGVNWGSLGLLVDMPRSIDRMRMIRKWYLEWFISRNLAATPEFSGALHRMRGPRRVGSGIFLVVDMGSAPVAALNDLTERLSGSGARHLMLISAKMNDLRQKAPSPPPGDVTTTDRP